jgi:hypothetical protein
VTNILLKAIDDASDWVVGVPADDPHSGAKTIARFIIFVTLSIVAGCIGGFAAWTVLVALELLLGCGSTSVLRVLPPVPIRNEVREHIMGLGGMGRHTP